MGFLDMVVTSPLGQGESAVILIGLAYPMNQPENERSRRTQPDAKYCFLTFELAPTQSGQLRRDCWTVPKAPKELSVDTN